MSKPLIYISTWKIKKGKLESLKRLSQELVELFMEREQQIIAFNTFINEEGTEMTSIQIHPDADSMDSHMKVLGQAFTEVEGMGEVMELIEPISIEIYGTPSVSLLESDRQLVESGVPRNIKPILIAGFTRSSAG